VYLTIVDDHTYPYAYQLWVTENALSESTPTWQQLTVSNILSSTYSVSLAVDPVAVDTIHLFVEQVVSAFSISCNCVSPGTGAKNWILTSADIT
jgi:hypothetical protein